VRFGIVPYHYDTGVTMNRILAMLLTVGITLGALPAGAGEPLRAYVAEFAITGSANREELKSALQSLVMSRLATGDLQTVDSPAGAHLTVKGSYIAFGKVFSLDLLAKDGSGRTVARSFQQGESQDELIPATAKASEALADEILRKVDRAALAVVAPAPVAPPVPAARPVPAEIVVTKRTPSVDTGSDIIRSAAAAPQVKGGKVSKRIPAVLKSLALASVNGSGVREMFMVDAERLYLTEFGTEYRIIDQVHLGGGVTTLGVDTADLDGDGQPEAYVTMMVGERLASQVFVRQNDKLVRIATGIELYFRGLSLSGKQKKLYGQEMGSNSDFYGKVGEVVKVGSRYELRNHLNLPDKATIFNFTRLSDQDGSELTVLLSPSGVLLVYGPDNKELWRSNDKFSGTETYFRRDDQQNQRFTGSSTRMVFLDQRLTVTPEGTLLVPQNDGTYVVGNSRDYKKHTVFAFIWNGSSLDELWHTKPSQTYLADYVYDGERKELVQLEVVAKDGPLEKGASALTVKRLE
jgi:hypothetical protein